MHLSKLDLINFKNHKESSLELIDGINGFYGKNGSGKTNVLDAIHHLSYTKSYFNSIDSQNVKFETPFYVIQGEVRQDEDVFSLYCGTPRFFMKAHKFVPIEATKQRLGVG